MKKLKKKLRSQAGESIGETLVALLIAALALTMLAGAISVSARVILQGRDKLDSYYKANEAPDGIVKMTESGTAGTVTITAEGIEEQPCTVTYFTNHEFSRTPVAAYQPSTESSGG